MGEKEKRGGRGGGEGGGGGGGGGRGGCIIVRPELVFLGRIVLSSPFPKYLSMRNVLQTDRPTDKVSKKGREKRRKREKGKRSKKGWRVVAKCRKFC